MQDKRGRVPDEKLGKFMAATSLVLMLPVLLLPHINPGTRATALVFCVSGVLYGRGQVAAAKKWRDEYGEPTPEDMAAIKKSHSINIFRLLALIVAVIAAFALFFLALAYCLSKFNAH
jgi:hypothetical protein